MPSGGGKTFKEGSESITFTIDDSTKIKVEMLQGEQDGTITAKKGDMFYVTNTICTINLTNVKFNLANDTFLRVAGNDSSRGWSTVNLVLDNKSKWVLTGDSYVTSFDGDTSNVVSNGHTLYVNGKAVTTK